MANPTLSMLTRLRPPLGLGFVEQFVEFGMPELARRERSRGNGVDADALGAGLGCDVAHPHFQGEPRLR